MATDKDSNMRTYLTLIRPVNAVMAGIGVLIGGIVASGEDFFTLDVLSGVLLAYVAAFMATGAGNAMNDIVDSETDKVNHPERPIPSGRLTISQVKRLVIAGYTITIVLAAIINYLNLAIAIINISLMLGYEYSFKGKGLIGNLTISYLTASVFLFGGVATLKNDHIIDLATAEETTVTLILSLLAFFVSAGREIIKDIQDMEGDTDRKTLPMSIGKKPAGIMAGILIIIAVGFSWMPYYLGILGIVYLGVVVICDLVFLNSVVMILRDPARSQFLAKIAMILGLMAFLIGSLI